MAMMAITTSSSISVKADRERFRQGMSGPPLATNLDLLTEGTHTKNALRREGRWEQATASIKERTRKETDDNSSVVSSQQAAYVNHLANSSPERTAAHGWGVIFLSGLSRGGQRKGPQHARVPRASGSFLSPRWTTPT